MNRRPRIPGYRRHSSGQARVTLDGKDHLLGPFGSAESKEGYRRLIAEWLAGHGRFAPKEDAEPIAVSELILAYWKFAKGYYGFDGKRGDEACLRDALRPVRSLYGRTPAREFGPKSLKACRQEMIEKGWSRTYVNAQVDRVRRMFRWAASEELLPPGVHEGLRAVSGLRAGKTEARETKKVRPAAAECIDAALARLPPVVAAMVRFQLLTGCRPDEVCRFRACDVDMQDRSCWVYRPGSDHGPYGRHKTAHHRHERLIFIGPKAQQVLRPYLGTKPDAYCFSPAEAEAEAVRAANRRKGRKTPLYASHLARMAAKRKPKPQRAPGDRYDTGSYRRAIRRACDMAHPLPERLGPRRQEDGKLESRAAWWARLTVEEQNEVRVWRRDHRWHPNQLRHSRATELRRHGLDVAKTILGHSKVETTQIYAEKDLKAAMELVGKIG
jgi:integrase